MKKAGTIYFDPFLSTVEKYERQRKISDWKFFALCLLILAVAVFMFWVLPILEWILEASLYLSKIL